MKFECKRFGVYVRELESTGFNHGHNRFKQVGGLNLPTSKLQMCTDEFSATDVDALAALSDQLDVPLTYRYDEDEDLHIVEIEVVSAKRVRTALT